MTSRIGRFVAALLALGATATALVVVTSAARAEPSPETEWCAPSLEALTKTVCFAAPTKPREGPRTLVVFLHGLTGNGSEWAWQQQRLMKRHAEIHGLFALMPRGRPGLGPGRDPNVLAWPTARALQEEHETALLDEWRRAKELASDRVGPFERVFVFGFSNGAYYATSLALRGKLDVNGYGVFAGGNGGKYHRLLGKQAPRRAPIFVGYGTKDRHHERQKRLVALLRELGWPHASLGERVGHTVTNRHIEAALEFLTEAPQPAEAPQSSMRAQTVAEPP